MLTAGDLNPVDAFKIIKLIYTVAKNARVHRETCTEFANYVTVISNLLTPLQNSQQIIEHPAVQDALAMLHKNLVKAFLLIQKCEHTSTLSALVKQVPKQLKQLEGEIQKTLSLLNLANLHLNMPITTNGSNAELSTEGLSLYPDVANSNLGVSYSLQETGAKHDSLPIRSFSVPSTSGQGLATAHSLSARSLSITWGADERYWKWVARDGSRFSEVAYVVDVYWLEVQGQLNTSTLRPGKYTLSWRLQVACLEDHDKPSGWECEPVVFKLSMSDGHQNTERSAFLVGTSDKLLKSGDKTLVLQNGYIRESTNGWMEFDVGTFTVSKKQSLVKLTFSMNEMNGIWKSGLFLDGVFITPCSDAKTQIFSDADHKTFSDVNKIFTDADNKIFSDGASSSTQGVQDLSSLPDMIDFSGHPHEVKLMRDPYWFACAVCEATALGVGYHCHHCLYSVHPECCISDYQFATLLDLTDSELSHWHWATLLELNKHRVEEKSTWPKAFMFAGHPHQLKLTQCSHPSFICDARDCDGQGWVYRGWDGWTYRCEGCDFDVHPECRF